MSQNPTGINGSVKKIVKKKMDSSLVHLFYFYLSYNFIRP